MKYFLFVMLMLVCFLLGCLGNGSSEAEIPVNVTTVYFFYSPSCPYCEEVKPLIENLAKEYSNVRFVLCNVNDCSGECKEIMENYRVMFIPTAVVIGKNGTTILTGSTEIENELEEVLNEI